MSRHESTAWWGKDNEKPAFQRVSSLKLAEKRPFVGDVSAVGLEPTTNGLKGCYPVFAFNNQCPALLDESLGGVKTKDIGVILRPESTLLQQCPCGFERTLVALSLAP